MATEDMNAPIWLVATLGMTAVMWMPYVLDRFVKIGIPRTLGNPQPGDADAQSAWAIRAKRAHANAVENLVVFAPLAILAIHHGTAAQGAVANACALYFFARLGHYVVFTAGVPVARTLAFLAGFAAQVLLLLQLLQG
jgi:uncharacterized MAPEG superfamily protein